MTQNLPNSKQLLSPGIIHIIIILIPVAIIAFIVISNLLPFGKRQNAFAQVGQKAPDFTLTDFSGKAVKLSDLEGKPLVLEFWDSRCLACLEELLILQKIQENLPQITFLGIHVNNSPIENQKRASSLISNNLQITFSQLEDTGGNVYGLYKFDNTDPITYFIDKNGIVTERFSGIKTEAEIASQIQKLLQ